MKPALFTYPYISSYPVLMLLGFVGGWILARKRAGFYRLDPRHFDNISLLVPMAALFGARLFARLFYAKLPLLEALKFWEGDGLVFYGGFVFGAGTVLSYGLVRRVNLAKLCDCLAPSIALGLAFGRVGCFLGGCCWGDLCVADAVLTRLEPETARQVQTFRAISGPGWPLAVRFPRKSEAFEQHEKLGLISSDADRSLPVHPVQLYEAALAAALAIWLHRRFQGEERAGNAALALLVGYAVIRFGTEYLRADNRSSALGLTISQLISVEILLFCLAAAAVRALVSPAKARKSNPAVCTVNV
jgi:phosphatidylglycerol:prolipoprotein diacylglycerol transferase